MNKIIEGIKIQKVISPTGGTASTCLYNGSAVSVSNNGIDTFGYDEIVFVVNYGTAYTGSSLDCSIMAASTNNPASASVVALLNDSGTSTNATFTAFGTTSNTIKNATIKCSNASRYQWLRTYQGSVTVNFSAVAILGKCKEEPISNSPEFEIGFAG